MNHFLERIEIEQKISSFNKNLMEVGKKLIETKTKKKLLKSKNTF